MAGFDHRKAAQRDQRKAERRAARAQRRAELHCWWTRPFRHEFIKAETDQFGRVVRVCVSCEKRTY